MRNPPGSTRYRVFLYGGVLPGRDPGRAAAALASTFEIEPDRLRHVLDQGSELTVEREVDRATAERSVQTILDAGARCRMVPMPAEAVRAQGQLPGSHTPPSAPPEVPGVAEAGAPEPERTEEEREWAAFVDENAEYYLPRFATFSEAGHAKLLPSWNTAAFIAPAAWALYRKMYPWALLTSLFGVPILANLFLGLFGNYLYYRTVRDELARIRLELPDGDRRYAIAAGGGVHDWVLPAAKIGGGILGALFLVGGLASVAIPAMLRNRPAEDQPREQAPTTASQPGSSTGPASRKKGMLPSGSAERQTMERMIRVRASIAGAIAERRATPSSLDELRGLSQDDLQDAWGQRLGMEREANVMNIRSAGPDRVWGSADDMSISLGVPKR